MRWSSLILLAPLVLLLLTERVQAWPWSRDMVDQPSVGPQESPIRLAPGTVPVSGRERSLSYKEADRLKNPIPSSPRSQENGRRLYAIYCALCHGTKGKGDGPIGERLGPPPEFSGLLGERTDGALYYQLLYGGEFMPAYKASMTPEQRWDVINYLRQLPAE